MEKFKNVQEMQAAYPEFCEEIANAATAAERNRIKDIESVTLNGFEEMANKAKFEEPKSAAQLSMAIIAAQKKEGESYLQARAKDAEESGVNGANAKNLGAGAENADAAFDKILDEIEKEMR